MWAVVITVTSRQRNEGNKKERNQAVNKRKHRADNVTW